VTASIGKWNQLELQPGDFGFDEYFRFQGSGVYWTESERRITYTTNGRTKNLKEKQYMPDLMHEFLVDLITRHKDEPFFVYYPMSQVHRNVPQRGMMRTPDSAPGSKDFFGDNIAYMDKLVGKLVDELERLKLRDKTLLLFVGDNGTANTESVASTVRGRTISGHKGEFLEGGSLVPMIANWPGVVPAGKTSRSLLDFSDFLPTLADFAGAPLPAGVTIDGHSFAPELRGQPGKSREWIFVELG
jgi:arylsulfatase A